MNKAEMELRGPPETGSLGADILPHRSGIGLFAIIVLFNCAIAGAASVHHRLALASIFVFSAFNILRVGRGNLGIVIHIITF